LFECVASIIQHYDRAPQGTSTASLDEIQLLLRGLQAIQAGSFHKSEACTTVASSGASQSDTPLQLTTYASRAGKPRVVRLSGYGRSVRPRKVNPACTFCLTPGHNICKCPAILRAGAPVVGPYNAFIDTVKTGVEQLEVPEVLSTGISPELVSDIKRACRAAPPGVVVRLVGWCPHGGTDYASLQVFFFGGGLLRV
jgi:hypothetical protein